MRRNCSRTATACAPVFATQALPCPRWCKAAAKRSGLAGNCRMMMRLCRACRCAACAFACVCAFAFACACFTTVTAAAGTGGGGCGCCAALLHRVRPGPAPKALPALRVGPSLQPAAQALGVFRKCKQLLPFDNVKECENAVCSSVSGA